MSRVRAYFARKKVGGKILADGKIVIETGLDTAGLKQGLSKISGLTKTGLKATAATLAGVSAGLLAAGGAAVKTGIEFESAFAGVKKTVDATDEQLAELRTGLIDMSKEMPQSASALAEIAEAAGQLGIKTENLEGFTKTMAQLGDATNLGATEAADALARFANITGMSQTEFDRLGSTIVSLGNNMATTESEIVAMGMRLAGAGSQVGMTEAQIMSLAAALSSVGIEAEAGGSAMSTVMSKMQLAVENGGESLQNFAQVAGMSADEFKQAFKTDAAGALLSFIDGLSKCEDQGVSAIKTLDDMGISEIRQRDALLRAAGATDVFAKALDLGSEAWETNTALANEAAQRYETLESKISMAKNSASALAIAFKDSVDTNLRAAVETGTEYLDRLAEAFTDGGLEGAVDEAGDIVADLATNIAESAPGMIDAAATLIQSFIKGVAKNKGSLKKAAKEIVKALADGLVDLLPPAMQKPVKKAIDAIADSFNDGGLKKAVETLGNLLENLGEGAVALADTALPLLADALDFLGQNADTLIPILAATVAGIKAFQLANQASAAAKGFEAAMKSLTTTLSANPIALAVGGISALIGLLGTAVLLTDDTTDATERLNAEQQESIELAEEQIAQIQSQAEARRQNIATATAEIDNAEDLWTELQKCVDENGKIKEGYEERARYITGELATALGIEIDIVDNQIQKYDELKSSIYDVIAAKKAQVALNAMESEYHTAQSEETRLTEELGKKYKALNDTKEKLNALEAEYEVEAGKTETVTNYLGATVEKHTTRWSELNEEIRNTEDVLQTQQAEFDAANASMQDNQKTISDYEMLLEAAMSGSAEKITSALAEIQRGVDTSLEAGSEAALQQAKGVSESLLNVLQMQADGIEGISQSAVDGTTEAMGMAINTISTSGESMKQLLESVGTDGAVKMLMAFQQADMGGNLSAEAQSGMQAMIAAIQGMEGSLSEEARTSLTTFISGFDTLSEESRLAWSQAWYGALSGLEGFENLADPAEQGTDAFLSTLNTALQTDGAQSGATRDIFAQTGTGASAGIESTKGEAVSSAASMTTEVCNAADQAMQDADLPGKFGSEAQESAESFNSGMTGNSSLVSAAVEHVFALAESTIGNSGIKSSAQKEGSAVPENMSTGIRSGTSGVDAAVSDLGDTAKNKLEGANLPKVSQKTGTETSGKLASGITSGKGQVATATGQTADSAKSTLQGANLPGHGYNQGGQFSSGLAGGILSGRSDVISAAIRVARSAWQASQRELEIHSPSRKTNYQGRMYDAGMETGILDDKDKVIQAGERVSRDLLETLDLPSAYAQMRAAMGANTVRVSGAYRIPKAVPAGEHAGFTREELKAIGETIGDVVNGRIEQMRFVFRERELGRMIREVQTV